MDKAHTKRRATAQKSLITAALRNQNRFISAQQLHTLLSADGRNVGLATIYRQLRSLHADGIVDAIQTEGEMLYRLCEAGEHHHHLLCTGCGTATDIALPTEAWIDDAAKAAGFTVSGHTLEIFGRCAACTDAASTPTKEPVRKR